MSDRAVCDCATCKLWRELDETRNKAAATIRAQAAEIERLKDEIDHQRKIGGDIMTGQKVVLPVEPTEAMDNAGAEAIVKHYNHYEAGAVTDVYEAMIRAAQEDTQPEPPSEGRE